MISMLIPSVFRFHHFLKLSDIKRQAITGFDTNRLGNPQSYVRVRSRSKSGETNQKDGEWMYDIVEKHWPMSEGDGKAARKKRPRILAITTDCCTGCAGSPACIEYCPIEACMFWVPDEDHPPFGR